MRARAATGTARFSLPSLRLAGIFPGALLMVDVGDLGSLLQFLVSLVEQFLGFRGMAGQIEFIGLLGCGDAVESVGRLLLCAAQVGVLLAADVLHRLLLRGWGRVHQGGCHSHQTQQQADRGKFFKHVIYFLLVRHLWALRTLNAIRKDKLRELLLFASVKLLRHHPDYSSDRQRWL